MKQVIVITGASSGFGALTARALADAGHVVYASMRETTGRNAPQVAEAARYAKEHGVDLRAVELDVASEESAKAGIAKVVADNGRLDVVIHNAGHMSFGPAEAFTPEQFAQLYDINVLSTQRVNRAALPQLRKQGRGLVVWVSSSSARGGTPPYLSPYFAGERRRWICLRCLTPASWSRWGIETAIIVPGAFHPEGTNHHSRIPAHPPTRRARPSMTRDLMPACRIRRLWGPPRLEPADADAGTVAEAIVFALSTRCSLGKRFRSRTHVDPSQDGAEIVNGVADRVRAEMFRRIGIADLLAPRANA